MGLERADPEAYSRLWPARSLNQWSDIYVDPALAHAATALIGVILIFEQAWYVAQLQPVRAAAGKAPAAI